jgi:PST family polysaccharide transporter
LPTRFHAIRALVWALIESGGLTVLSLAVLFLVARILGPADFGTAALAIGMVQMATILIDTLLHDAIVQRSDLQREHLDTAFWTCLALGMIASAVTWAAAPLLGEIFASANLPALLAAAGLSLALSGSASIATAVLRRRLLFKELAVRTLLGRLCGAFTAIALALSGYGIWSLIGQHLVQTAINTALIWWLSPWRPAFRFSRERLHELLSFGALTLGSRLAWLSSGRVFTILIGYYLGIAAVGYISVAQKIVDTLYDLLSGVAYNLALPLLSRQQDNTDALTKTYAQATELGAVFVQPIFAGLAVCAPGVVGLFLGESWAPVVPLVQVIAIGAALQFSLLFGDALLNAVGRPAFAFAYAALSFLFVVVATVTFPPTDALHAALVWSMRMLVAGPLLLAAVDRVLGRSLAVGLLKGMIAPLAATAIMAATLLAVRVSAPGGLAPLVLLGQVALGAMSYWLALALIKPEFARRLLRLSITALVSFRSGTPARGGARD